MKVSRLASLLIFKVTNFHCYIFLVNDSGSGSSSRNSFWISFIPDILLSMSTRIVWRIVLYYIPDPASVKITSKLWISEVNYYYYINTDYC